MEKLTINACPLCGSTHLKGVMTCTDFYASGEQFELYSCEDCGFTFTQDVPVEAEIGKYYETPDYISHTDTRKGAMNSVYHYVRSLRPIALSQAMLPTYIPFRKLKELPRCFSLSMDT